MPELLTVATPEHLEVARVLFREYADSIAPFASASLHRQGFEAELASLPGRYASPSGCILLALEDARPLGCGALRPLDQDACEMKRVYVRPIARGKGIGRLLCEALIARAIDIGYRTMKLDTEPAMHAAQALYRTLGFVLIPRYNDSTETIHMGLDLRTLNPGVGQSPCGE